MQIDPESTLGALHASQHPPPLGHGGRPSSANTPMLAGHEGGEHVRPMPSQVGTNLASPPSLRTTSLVEQPMSDNAMSDNAMSDPVRLARDPRAPLPHEKREVFVELWHSPLLGEGSRASRRSREVRAASGVRTTASSAQESRTLPIGTVFSPTFARVGLCGCARDCHLHPYPGVPSGRGQPAWRR